LNSNEQHFSEAESLIKKAIEEDEKYDMRWHLARDYALYAEIFKQQADPKLAGENLNKTIEIFKECGADGWVEKYEKELASLS
jgi:Tfp pilus assembly protein PilF